MEPLFSELWWKIKIEWQEAEAYEQVKNGSSYDFDEKAFLYMITGRFSNRAPKLFYIGKTYFQVVSWRLGQEDHRRRYEQLRRDYPKHKLYVNIGLVKILNGVINPKRVDHIERLLIYAHDFEHKINQKSIYTHGLGEACYEIVNEGYYHPLHQQIFYGPMFRP